MALKLAILDLDGTLYRASEAIPHAAASVASLRNMGLAVRFVTNNSGAHQSLLAEKLLRLGFDLDPSEAISSAMGAARYAKAQGWTSAFVVGEAGLIRTLEESGIAAVRDRPQCVVAGICRSLTYAWIDQALQHLSAGVPFIATNTDATYPIEQGAFQPGAGATVGALSGCSKREPIVIGKPNPYLVTMALESAGVPAGEAVVVGDRFETDIEAGLAAGCQTWMVLSGVTAQAPAGVQASEDLRGLAEWAAGQV
jgi:4-nitrophenyl phosphatase